MYLSYVYFVTNKITNEFYIGSRYKNIQLKKSPEEDIWVHYFTSSKDIKKLIDMYGKDSFDVKIITRYGEYDPCYWYEQYLIKENIKNPLCLNGAYIDVCHSVKFSTAGRKATPEERKRLSEAKKNPSEETRARYSACKLGKNTGSRSQSTRDKISKTHTGNKLTEEHCNNISKSKRGALHPGYGKQRSPETKAKMVKSQAECKELRSSKAKELWANPEYRERMLKRSPRGKSNKPTTNKSKSERMIYAERRCAELVGIDDRRQIIIKEMMSIFNITQNSAKTYYNYFK